VEQHGVEPGAVQLAVDMLDQRCAGSGAPPAGQHHEVRRMLPAQAAQARRWVREGADEAGRAAPVVASYVRVAVGSGSLQRLCDEESHYRSINENHRKHFEAMNVPLGSVGVAASARSEVLDGFAPYHCALDLPIARLLAEHDATSLSAGAVAAAP
jgi:hypothetical protein